MLVIAREYILSDLNDIDVIFHGHKSENTQDVEDLRHVEHD